MSAARPNNTSSGAGDPVLAELIGARTLAELTARLPALRGYVEAITDPLQRESIRATVFDAARRLGYPRPGTLADLVMNDAGPGPIAADGPDGRSLDEKIPQSQRLAAFANDAELFHSRDGDTGFATVVVNGHPETWPIRSRGFRHWLIARFYQSQKRPPGAQPLSDALALLEARARIEGPAGDVFLRVAPHDSAIYVDLATDDHRAVQITRAGWQVVIDPPVKFLRSRGMLALPAPVLGGSIADLWRFVNVAPEDRPLFAGMLLMAFNPRGPYPVLVLHGSHGAAKSSSARVFQRLVDPNLGDLRAEPREVRDLAIAVSNSWLAAFDNLSWVQPWFSDCLCRLSTGAGFATRELYSDRDETIIAAQRPVVLNGIEEIVTRPDLLSRSVIIYLPEIDSGNRLDERTFWRDFETAQPALLGAIFTAVSAALRNLDAVQLDSAPRMVDFARFVAAGEAALGFESGKFMVAYRATIAASHDLALEASPIAPHIQALVGEHGWTGTAKEFLAALAARADDATRKARGWPKSPKAAANALRRIAANLQAAGISVRFDNRPELSQRRRQIILSPEKTGNDRSDRSDRSGTTFGGPPGAPANDAELSERSFPLFSGVSAPPPKSDTESPLNPGDELEEGRL